jgi:UDP-galactopyranose mutase
MLDRRAIVTFSHLRWNFVYQRPQHLLSRMAQRREVFFIEEPLIDTSAPGHLVQSNPAENITVICPHTPITSSGFDDAQAATLKELLAPLFFRLLPDEYDVWMYTPMALPFLQELKPRVVIFDCMDNLAGFLNAPADIEAKESRLFEIADLVFTGGPSLYEAKKDRHPNIHCFPSSVDREHFERGVAEQQEPADQVPLRHPRLGYFGVIDERIDLKILDTLAESHPEWEIVMVGPVVKIDPATLPRRPNITYFGQRPYSELPGYIKGWDLCLLPFAQNSATTFISPTKTLEYMAAGKLMVSTPISDVARPYGDVVFLADTPRTFVEACESALSTSKAERDRKIQHQRSIVSETSWDRTVAQMESLIDQAEIAPRAATGRIGSGKSIVSKEHEDPVVVIGAGPTGLSAAYHLGERALLLEQNERPGGWCRSIEVNGFTFDYSGHIMFSADPYVHELYQMLLNDNVHWQDREAWIYSKNVYTRYPFQGSLYGLPPDVIKECIVGAIEARFGPLKTATNGSANGTNGKGACGTNASVPVKDCCADGILESSLKTSRVEAFGRERTAPRNFQEFIYNVWGAGIAKHFAIPYNRKLWTVPLEEMETSWLGGRVPMPDLEEIIEGSLRTAPKPMGPNARFGYPLRGGFQALMDGFLPHLSGRLLLNKTVTAIHPRQRTVVVADGSEYRYSRLISTMPLPALIRSMSDVPQETREAARRLRHVSVRCVHIGVGRPNLTDKHWIYYPEDTIFHRIFVQGNASPYCNPPGGFGLTCEITYSDLKPLPAEGDELIQKIIADCHRVGIFTPEDKVLATAQCDLPFAYVVYDHARKQCVDGIREWLDKQGILLAGRYSEWEYYNSDHAFIAGKKASDSVLSALGQPPKPERAAQAPALTSASVAQLTRLSKGSHGSLDDPRMHVRCLES